MRKEARGAIFGRTKDFRETNEQEWQRSLSQKNIPPTRAVHVFSFDPWVHDLGVVAVRLGRNKGFPTRSSGKKVRPEAGIHLQTGG